MGGLVGQWLALHAPSRLQRLVLCNTAAKIGNAEGWSARIDTVLRDGTRAMRELRDASIERWFTAEFAGERPQQVEAVVAMLAATSPQGYAANCAAVRDADFREQLGAIRLPVLVVCGSADAVTTPADGRFMVERMADARMIELHAAHLSNVEAAGRFSDSVLDFLTTRAAG
jgi:3-oxoadipate enol-lactonase